MSADVDLPALPGYWHGPAGGEARQLRAELARRDREIARLRAAVDWRDRRIGDLELRARGAPAPSPDLIARMRKALEGWRPAT